MPKELSCGFILFQKGTDRLLVCHPNGKPGTGYHSFDIPKGHIEDNEEPFDAAMRELREETGITEVEDIRDLGHCPYQSTKALHLFSAYADFDINQLHCDSMFTDNFGNEKREVDKYRLTRDPELLFKNMWWYAANEMRARGMLRKVSVDVSGKLFWSVSYLAEKRIEDLLWQINALKDANRWKPDAEYCIQNGVPEDYPDDYKYLVTYDKIEKALRNSEPVGDSFPMDRRVETICPFPFEECLEDLWQ